jgi:hypothetical protein
MHWGPGVRCRGIPHTTDMSPRGGNSCQRAQGSSLLSGGSVSPDVLPTTAGKPKWGRRSSVWLRGSAQSGQHVSPSAHMRRTWYWGERGFSTRRLVCFPGNGKVLAIANHRKDRVKTLQPFLRSANADVRSRTTRLRSSQRWKAGDTATLGYPLVPKLLQRSVARSASERG